MLISVAAALCFHGCRLISVVADLLESFILSRNEPKKKQLFIKVFTTSKTFCNIDMYKYKFKMYKGLWITVNQTNRWTKSVFWGSVWSPANFTEELPIPREVLIKAGCANNVRKERKRKNACGYKTPTQNHSVRGRWKRKGNQK